MATNVENQSKSEISNPSFDFQPIDGLPTAQTCFLVLRLPPYTSKSVMAERIRYAIQNCRSIDMDSYMLERNQPQDNTEEEDGSS